MFHKKQQLSLFDLAEKSSLRPLGVNLDLAKGQGTAEQLNSNSVFVMLAMINLYHKFLHSPRFLLAASITLEPSVGPPLWFCPLLWGIPSTLSCCFSSCLVGRIQADGCQQRREGEEMLVEGIMALQTSIKPCHWGHQWERADKRPLQSSSGCQCALPGTQKWFSHAQPKSTARKEHYCCEVKSASQPSFRPQFISKHTPNPPSWEK